MTPSWQEHFFEKLVNIVCSEGDVRVATATLHRRKKTASFPHQQLHKVEYAFGTSCTGGRQSQVLLISLNRNEPLRLPLQY